MSRRGFVSGGSVAFFAMLLVSCSSSENASAPSGASDASAGSGGANGGSGSGAGGANTGGGSSGGGLSGSGGSGTGNGGTTGAGGATGRGGRPQPDGGQIAAFWDTGPIPPAQNVMVFRFLNRTNGVYADSEVFWRFKTGNINEFHSIAEQDTYDMPANSSGRLYFYLCHTGDADCAADPTKSKYYDFIEHTIGAAQYNGNTTRVDAFGLKIAMRLHCADGYDRAVGEDYQTFADDRAVTFQQFIDAVPDEFDPLAEAPHAPYRIVEPGAEGFGTNGAYAHYYDSFVDEMWAQNGITVPKPGPNGSGLGSYPNLSAAIFRHVGSAAGTFDANGKLLDTHLWDDPKTFYPSAPANYYAKFWHDHALDGKAYGFPYDDVGSQSSYVSHKNPEYLLIAVGW